MHTTPESRARLRAERAAYNRGVQDTLERLRDSAAVERAAKAIDAYIPLTAVGNYAISGQVFLDALEAALSSPTESGDA